jgi:pseudouridine-5'-phosphate glycosidase
MTTPLPEVFVIQEEIQRALEEKKPLVALESAVITHGLPYPDNLSLAQDMEARVRSNGAVPATIALFEGRVRVGLNSAQVQRLSDGSLRPEKISTRDIGPALARGGSGGTTVAATLFAAWRAGIRVFATGGIGGVHRGDRLHKAVTFDISADLPALGAYPAVVVCAGAKAILDLPATLEYLETMGVPVIGYQTNDFPAFYSRTAANLKTSARADTPEQAAAMALAHWSLLSTAVLLVVPPPEDEALPWDEIEVKIRQALRVARDQRVRGKDVTPFLLQRLDMLTGGSSKRANLSLLRNNAEIGARVARALRLLQG